jgi:hypothetical protein
VIQKLTLALLLIALYRSSTAVAAADEIGWAPPVLFSIAGDTVPSPTVPRELITRFRVADMNVVLEETRLSEVQRHFGGEIGKSGDAGDFVQWLCLQGRDAAGRWALWLTSGEIHGGLVGMFEWLRIPERSSMDRRCHPLSRRPRQVRLPISIRLGDNGAHVEALLGVPTLKRGESVLYAHEHERMIRRQPFTTLNQIVVVLRDGAVQAVGVARTTAN